MKISAEVTRSYAFIRIGRFEVHVERDGERVRQLAGEVVCYVGRWAVHMVNHERAGLIR